jgi:hypothetical protein
MLVPLQKESLRLTATNSTIAMNSTLVVGLGFPDALVYRNPYKMLVNHTSPTQMLWRESSVTRPKKREKAHAV